MHRWVVVSLLSVVVLAAGCGSSSKDAGSATDTTSTTAATTTTTRLPGARGIKSYAGQGTTLIEHFPWNKQPRQYRVFVPTGLDPSVAAPLVVVLPGTGGTSKAMETATGFDGIANLGKF